MKNCKNPRPTLSVANAANDLHATLSMDFCEHLIIPSVAELAKKAMIYRNPDLIVMEVLRHYTEVCVEEIKAEARHKKRKKKPKPARRRKSK